MTTHYLTKEEVEMEIDERFVHIPKDVLSFSNWLRTTELEAVIEMIEELSTHRFIDARKGDVILWMHVRGLLNLLENLKKEI